MTAGRPMHCAGPFLTPKRMNILRKFKKYLFIIRQSRRQEGENISPGSLLLRILHWMVKRHGTVMDFFIMGFHKKGKEPGDYISDREFLSIHEKLNPRYYLSILEDKYVFDRFLSSFGFPLAEMTGLLENGFITWIPGREKEPVENLLHYNLDCYCKHHTGWGGSKVHHLVVKDGNLMVNRKENTMEALKSITENGIYVLQKTLVQHPEMNRLNPSCVNTLRIITIHDGKTVHKHAGFIRIGIGGSHVDNISSGNIACGIREDGTLFDEASDVYLTKVGLKRHPDTGVVFGSFTVPYFREAVNLALDMHKAFHCFFIIGWDIAITSSGPVVIEGNPVATLSLEQAIVGGVRKEFCRMAQEYRENRKLTLR